MAAMEIILSKITENPSLLQGYFHFSSFGA